MARLVPAAAILLFASSTAFGQPADPEPPPPEQPPPVAPFPDLDDIYDQAFADLADGKLTAAIAGFNRVAAAGGAKASSARELARLANTLRMRNVQFVVSGPTGPAGSQKPVAAVVVSEEDQPSSGRTSFVAGTTLAGFYGGLVAVDLSDTDDFRTGTILVVAGTGIGFAASLLGTRNRSITSGVADAYTLGLSLGATNGLLLAAPLDLDSSEQVLTVGFASMAAGGAAGLLLGDAARPTVAQTRVVGLGSTLGIATVGLGIASLDLDLDADTVLLALAGGLDVGAGVGAYFSQGLTWSKNRAGLVSLGLFLGGLAGFGTAAIIVGEPDGIDEARLMSLATLGGIWGGTLLTVHLTRDMSPDPRYRRGKTLALTPMVTQTGGRGFAFSGTF